LKKKRFAERRLEGEGTAIKIKKSAVEDKSANLRYRGAGAHGQ